MAGLKAPEEFDLDSCNAKQEWNTWIEQYDLYACATELDSKDEKIQIATLFTCISACARKIYETSTLDNKEKAIMIKVKEMFNKYVTHLINIPYERCVFNRRIQQQHETFYQFLTEIRRLGNICELENITAYEILRDRLLLGLRDENLRKRLLKDNKLTLKL